MDMVFPVFIVLLFCIFMFRFLGRVHEQQKCFNKGLAQLECSEVTRFISENDFYGSKLYTHFRSTENERLNAAWDAFCVGISEMERDRGKEIGKEIYMTRSASFFFTEDRLLTDALNLRFWNSVPSLLVGIGILGTFVGLVLGLWDFNVQEDGTIQTKTIQTLLEGMRTAFISSVVGMFLSLIFLGVERRVIYRLNESIRKLRDGLDSKFIPLPNELTQLQQLEQDRVIAKQQKQMVDILTETLGKLSGVISGQLQPTLNFLEKTVAELRRQKAESSKEITDSISKGMGGLREELKYLLDPLAETFNETSSSLKILPAQLEEQMKEVGKTVQSLNTEFNQTIMKLSTNVNSASESIKDLLSQQKQQITEIHQLSVETGTALAEGTEKIKETLGEATSEFTGVLSGAANDLKLNTDGTSENIKDLLSQQKQQITEMHQLSVETGTALAEGTEKIKETLGEATSEFTGVLSGAANDLKLNTDGTSENIKDLLSQQKQEITEIHQLSVETGTALAEGTEKIKETLGEATSEFTGVLSGAANDLKLNTDGTSENIKDLLSQQKQEITEIHQLSVETGTALAEGTEKIKETLGEATSEFTGVLSGAANDLKLNTDGTSENIKDLLSQQKQQITEMHQLSVETGTALAEGTEKIKETLGEATSEFTGVLSGAANDLKLNTDGTSENIKDLLSQQKQQITEMHQLSVETGTALAEGTEKIKETLGEATSEFTGVLSGAANDLKLNTDGTSENIKDLLSQQTEYINTVKSLGIDLKVNLKEIIDALTTASRVFSTGNGTYQKQMEDILQRFEAIDDSLGKIFAQIDTGLAQNLQTASGLIDTSLSAFSDQLAKAVGTLTKIDDPSDDTSEEGI